MVFTTIYWLFGKQWTIKFKLAVICWSLITELSLPGIFNWSLGHFWIWRLWEKQLWTILYKLRKRATSLLLQSAHFQVWTRGICSGRNCLEEYRIYWQHSLSGSLLQETHRSSLLIGWRVQVSESYICNFYLVCYLYSFVQKWHYTQSSILTSPRWKILVEWICRTIDGRVKKRCAGIFVLR